MSKIVDKINEQEKVYTIAERPTDLDIENAEKQLNIKFSKEYKEYIKEFGSVSFGANDLTGVCDYPESNVVDITIEERLRNPQIPLDYYVIEQANIDGIVIWQNAKGEIFQSQPGAKTIHMCDSLCEYIDIMTAED